jgi:hypothetical protein
MRGWVVTVAAIVAMLAGCTASPSDGEGVSPPIVTVVGDDGEVALSPVSFCWHDDDAGACGDGTEPDDPPRITATDGIEIRFPEPDWDFEASVSEVSAVDCPVELTTAAEPAGDGVWTLDPVGSAGDWRVHLFGTGPQGDVFVTFVWVSAGAADVATETDAVDPVTCTT